MEFKHRAVFYEEVIDFLNIREDGIYVDATMGGAGHGEGICQRLGPRGYYIGIDKDGEAVKKGGEQLRDYPAKKAFIQEDYRNIKSVLKGLEIQEIDGGLLDLGVSSYQLDNPERGFSYMQEGPLDMRMDQTKGITAYELVNEYPKNELARIIRDYGEERFYERIADRIDKERKKKAIESSLELAEIIKSAIPAATRRTGPHPAKRTFQALRIEVNQELAGLENSLEDFLDCLRPKGRLLVISFHSLEDRIVKNVFNRRLNPCTCPKEFPVCVCNKKGDIKKVTNKPWVPGEEELRENPRARSAKLRVVEKIGV